LSRSRPSRSRASRSFSGSIPRVPATSRWTGAAKRGSATRSAMT
jgi:hypothetical protein